MSLRIYQEECNEAILAAWRGGENRLLASMPTATGKTRTMGALVNRLLADDFGQVMAIAHREEIIDQLAEALQKANPRRTVGIERAQDRCNPATTDIIIGSVETLGRATEAGAGRWNYCDRISRFDRNSLKYLMIDEAHHACATSYQHLLRYFKCLKSDPATNDPAKLVCGWTATPTRADNIGLEEIFDRMVFWRDIRTMVEDGWLAPIKAYRVDTGIDISKIRSKGGDFIVKELERVVNTEKRNELILQKYQEMGEKMGFLCFTVDVQHSEDISALFRRNGIEVYPVSYKTPKQERRELINALRDRKIDGIASCQAVTEGTDIPSAAVALMTRPTKSSVLYTQCLGRVLRPCPSPEDMAGMAFLDAKPAWVKPYAVVLDFVDVCGKHRISGVPTLFGLRQDYKFDKQKTVTEELNEIDEMAKKAKGIDLTKYSNVIEMRAAVEAIDLFAVPSVPEAVQQYSKLAWTAAFSGGYNLHLPERLSFALRQNALGQWDVFRTVKGVREFMRTLPNIGLAFQMADNLVPQDKIGVVLAKAKWRNQEASPEQIKTLAKYRKDMRAKFPDYKDFVAWVKKTYTKGDVSRLLDEVFGKRRRA